jgi:ABC-2 type transport system permease protein
MNPLYTLTVRELKKWFRRRIAIIFTFITPLFWLGLFGKSINFYNLFNPSSTTLPPQFVQMVQQAIDSLIIGAFGTKDYFSFLATGMLSIFILFSSMFSGMTFIFDRRLGFLNRLLVSPVKREWIYFSRVVATIIKSLLQLTALLIIALSLGLQLKEGFNIMDMLGVYATLGLLSLIFGNIFIAISMKIEEHETSIAINNLLNLPLMFASNSLFPLNQMPDWLKYVAEVNPISHTNKVIRNFILGVGEAFPTESLIYLAALALITTVIGFLVSRKVLSRL